MQKFVLTMIIASLPFAAMSRDYFRHPFPKDVPHVLLANPTVANLETVRFLTEQGIFRVTEETRFVGVFHSGQAYDFGKSEVYLREHPELGFYLHEVRGALDDSSVFGENGCSAEFRTLFEHSAGILFFGGPDIQPRLYGEENQGSVVTDPGRHTFEVSLLFHLVGSSRQPDWRPFLEEKPGYLVTGFCLGMQTMNVAAGGTLWQDIPRQVYGKEGPRQTLETSRENLHRNYWQEISDDPRLMGINLHSLRFTGHPFFPKQVKVRRQSRPLIYSSHHQSPRDVGQGYMITALSPDGQIIEGLAHREYPHVFGVQFHPEVPALYENRELWKFAPEDTPRSYHLLIGSRSVRFHRKYWDYISECLEKSIHMHNR
jgi:putative glutamine amidotransferase